MHGEIRSVKEGGYSSGTHHGVTWYRGGSINNIVQALLEFTFPVILFLWWGLCPPSCCQSGGN